MEEAAETGSVSSGLRQFDDLRTSRVSQTARQSHQKISFQLSHEFLHFPPLISFLFFMKAFRSYESMMYAGYWIMRYWGRKSDSISVLDGRMTN